MDFKLAFKFLQHIAQKYSQDNISRHAAALAFYAIFSLAPMLIIMVALFGLFMGESTARDQIVYEVGSRFGAGAAQAVQTILDGLSVPELNTLAAAIGVVTMILGSTAAFAELIQSLNAIWAVKPQAGGVRAKVRQRAKAFLMVLTVGILFLISFGASLAITIAANIASPFFPFSGILTEVLDNVLSVLTFTFAFALVFRLLPLTTVAWRDVWVGAVATSLLFTIGKTLIALYLTHASPGSAYGAAGSLVMILLWIYYSSQVFLIGAEFTQAYSLWFGSRSLKEAKRGTAKGAGGDDLPAGSSPESLR